MPCIIFGSIGLAIQILNGKLGSGSSLAGHAACAATGFAVGFVVSECGKLGIQASPVKHKRSRGF